jgi:beta-phosphoglucomutase-like phosphatase (HAD superfamily)
MARDEPPTDFPSAALFDLDGTIVDTERLKSLALARACDGVDAPIPAEVLDALVGRAWPDVFRVLDLDRRAGWDLEAFVDAVMVETGRLLDDGWAIEPLPGAVELIDRLHGGGVPVGIVTGSYRRELDVVIDLLGLDGRLAVTLTAEDYTRGKPDPECYLAAAAVLGLSPRCCIAIEDSAPGIASARAAGMPVIATAAANPAPGRAGHQDQSGADAVVPDLTGVTASVLWALAPSGRHPGRAE